jgi:hypothetical protein
MRPQRNPLFAIVLVAVVALAGCTALPPLPLPTVTPRAAGAVAETAIVPEMTPTAASEPTAATRPASEAATPPAAPTEVVPTGPATVPDGCVPFEGEALLVRADDGYCLTYPTRYRVIRDVPENLSIVGPALDESIEPVMAAFGVTVSEAPGDIETSIKAAMAEFAGFTEWTIDRLDVELGGVPAAMFEPVPGRLSGRLLLAVHGGKLYRLDFWPVDVEVALSDVNELYNSVISTWQFIPAAPAVSISGAVVWGEQNVPGAVVELRTPDWRVNPNSIVATTISDAQGQYQFDAPLSGRYEIVPAFPAEAQEVGPQAGIPVIVAPGGAVTGLNVYLARQVTLLDPVPGAEVDAAPTLQWEPVEGAALYRVIVNDPGTMEGYFGVDVTGTSVKIDPPLMAGASYAWVVNALTANQGLLGVGEGSFTVK